MTTSEKLIKIAENVQKNVEFGKSQGGGGTDWLYYATRLDSTFGGAIFPENAEIVIRVKGENLNNCGYLFNNAKNIKSVKMITETPDTVLDMTAFCAVGSATTPTLELVDFSEFNKQFKNTFNMFAYQRKLKKIIGAMDLTSCTNTTNMFRNNSSLEDVEFVEGTICLSINLSACSKLNAKSLHSVLMGLSPTVTGQTLTLPKYATCKATYDAVYGDGSFDIIVASKTNWTIAHS